MAGTAKLVARLVEAACRDEAEGEQKGLGIPRELLVRRAPVGVPIIGVPIRLEQPTNEAAQTARSLLWRMVSGMCGDQPLPEWPSNGGCFANPHASHQIVSGTEWNATSA